MMKWAAPGRESLLHDRADVDAAQNAVAWFLRIWLIVVKLEFYIGLSLIKSSQLPCHSNGNGQD